MLLIPAPALVLWSPVNCLLYYYIQCMSLVASDTMATDQAGPHCSLPAGPEDASLCLPQLLRLPGLPLSHGPTGARR